MDDIQEVVLFGFTLDLMSMFFGAAMLSLVITILDTILQFILNILTVIPRVKRFLKELEVPINVIDQIKAQDKDDG